MLAVQHAVVRFGDHAALDGVDLTVRDGELMAVLGPSGSGKSTLLRAIAGLEPLQSGTITWDGSDLAGVPAHRRRFGLMFQDYALFPHKDVAGNVGFGLRMQGRPAEEVRARVQEVLALVDLDGFGHRSVTTLSGGEQQRVALARALAPEPRLLMLDEPLGALDRTLRERLTIDLEQLLHRIGMTSIYVTHDHAEARAIGDQLVVMRAGASSRSAHPTRSSRTRPTTSSLGSWAWRSPGVAQAATPAIDTTCLPSSISNKRSPFVANVSRVGLWNVVSGAMRVITPVVWSMRITRPAERTLTYKLSCASTVTPRGPGPSFRSAASVPSGASRSRVAPRPRTVSIVPSGFTRLTTPCPSSARYITPWLSTTTSLMRPNCACTAGPPSPTTASLRGDRARAGVGGQRAVGAEQLDVALAAEHEVDLILRPGRQQQAEHLVALLVGADVGERLVGPQPLLGETVVNTTDPSLWVATPVNSFSPFAKSPG